MLKNEKGFTFIELLVVLAIISVAISITTLSPSALFNKHIEGYALDLASALREARYIQLSKQDDCFIRLKKEDSKYIIETIQQLNDGTETVIKNTEMKSGYEIWYQKDEHTSEVLVDTIATPYDITFSKSNGKVEDTDRAGTYIIKGSSGTKERKVLLYPITGKVEMK